MREIIIEKNMFGEAMISIFSVHLDMLLSLRLFI